MPYKIRKQKCRQSSGKKGSYVLSYKDNKGKKHRACHTSRKKARGQIAAIEAEGTQKDTTMKITLSELRQLIKEAITSLTSREGQEVAFDSAPTRIDAPFFLTKEKLKGHISKIADVLDDTTLFDTLKNMLDRDESTSDKSAYKLDPKFKIFIKNQLEKWEKLTGPGGSTNVEQLDRDIEALIDETLDGLYSKQYVSSPEQKEREEEESRIADKMKKFIAGYPPEEDIEKYLAGIGKLSGRGTSRQIGMNESSLRNLKQLIHQYVLEEAKKAKKKKAKKKHDMDGDGDEDAADYKINQYMAGGMSKQDALKKSRKFNK